MAEWLLVHDVERTFRLDSNQRGEDFPSARGTIITSAYKSLLLWTRHSGVTVFPSARGSKNRYPAEGVSPRGYLLVHDLERTFRLDSNQTEPGAGAPAPAYGGVVTGSRRGENVPTGLEPARRRFSERARNQKSLPRRGRKPEGLLVRARGTYIERTPEACLWGSFYICSPDWTRTSNPSINSRMLCQLSYGGIFCFRCAVSLATSNNYTGGLGAPQAEI